MAFSRPDVLRHELEPRSPSAPSPSASGTAPSCPQPRRRRPADVQRPLAQGDRPRAARARPARSRPRLRRGRDRRRRHRRRRSAARTGSRRRSTAPTRRGSLLAAVRAAGLQRPPAPPEAELRPQGRATPRARLALGPPPLRRLQRVLRALPRRHDDLQCAIFERPTSRSRTPRTNKRETVCRKLALKPGERVLDVGCGWGASPCTRPSSTARTSSASRSPSRRPSARGSGPRRTAWPTGSRSASMDYRDLRGRAVRRDRRDRDGRARRRRATSTPTRAALAGLLEPGRAPAQPRHRPPAPHRRRGGPVLRALRVPRRRPAAPLAHPVRARARRLRDQPRRGLRASTTPTR